MGEQLDAEEKAVQAQWFIIRDKSKRKTGWGFVTFYTNSQRVLDMAGDFLELLEDALSRRKETGIPLEGWLRFNADLAQMTQREENVGQDDVGSVKQDRG